MAETICILRNGAGLDFSRYVERVFRNEDTARKYVNSLDCNVMLRAVPGKWKVGATVPLATRTRAL